MKPRNFQSPRSGIKRYIKALLIFSTIGGCVVVYGNACSVRRSEEAVNLTSESGPDSTATAGRGILKLTKEDVEACVGETADFESLATCLFSKSIVTQEFLANISRAVTECSSEKTNKIFMGMCLASKGVVIDRYRNPMQGDIDTCVAKVGEPQIANCLGKNGLLPSNINQAAISSCISAVGSGKLEKCLRKRGLLPFSGVISQFDYALCLKAGSKNVYDCLGNNDLLPAAAISTAENFVAQFTKADLDSCEASVSSTGTPVIKCLRFFGKMSRVLLNHHIEKCVSLVGQSKLAACLDANGILPSKEGVFITQTQLDSCINDRGLENIMSCLRWDLGYLNRVVSQAEILECNRLRGPTGLGKCLYQNDILPANVTQTVLDACAVIVAANPNTTIAKCLRKKSFVSKALLQADVNNCLKLVDNTKLAACLNSNVAGFAAFVQTDLDDCIAKVGPASVAKCLKNKSLIPTVLTQEHINGCSVFAGMGNIAACLNGSGFVDTAAAVPITQDLVDKCVSSVGLANVRKCLGNNSAAAKAISAETTAACTLFSDGTTEGITACNVANGFQ